jgi:hypothetical protein
VIAGTGSFGLNAGRAGWALRRARLASTNRSCLFELTIFCAYFWFIAKVALLRINIGMQAGFNGGELVTPDFTGQDLFSLL